MGLWQYMKLGLPSMLFIVLEWSSYDVQTVIAGYISLEDQACQIIMLNLTNNLFTLALGINTAACTLIGTQIGNMNVENAKNYMIAIVKFMIMVGLIEGTILWML